MNLTLALYLFCRYVKPMKLLGLSFVITIFLTAQSCFSVDLEYDINAFGQTIATITISGSGADILTVTPNQNGKTITVSGHTGSFKSKRSHPLPDLFKEIRSVNYQGNNMLIIELAYANEVSAASSPDTLKIIIKPTIGESKSSINLNHNSPKATNNHTIMTLEHISEGTTTLTRSLRSSAFLIEILLAILNGSGVSFNVDTDVSAVRLKELEQQNIEADSLINDLNMEILELRDELKKVPKK